MSTIQQKAYANKTKLLEGSVWLVPCFASLEANFFQPLFRPSTTICTPNTEGWTSLEENLLERIIKQHKSLCWAKIAKEFNLTAFKREDVRTPRQCKERWINHVQLGRRRWTLEEDISLMVIQRDIGNNWREIAKQLEGRTENSVKKRWASLYLEAKMKYPNVGNPIERFIEDTLARQEAIRRQDFTQVI